MNLLKKKNKTEICLAILLLHFAYPAVAEEFNVPSDDYPDIPSAITAAADTADSDTIIVAPGTYELSESLFPVSNVSLRGEDTSRTILTLAEDSTSTTIISLLNVTNVTIKHFTFVDASRAVFFENSQTITVANNVFTLGEENTAIEIDDLSDTTISNNTFYKNAYAIRGINAGVAIHDNIFAYNDVAVDSNVFVTDFTYNCYFQNENNGQTIDVTSLESTDTDASFAFIDSNGFEHDFNLRTGSECIDLNENTNLKDKYDDSAVDAGAFGGDEVTIYPYPARDVTLGLATQGAATSFDVPVSWDANLSYRVANSGGYEVFYQNKPITSLTDLTPVADLQSDTTANVSVTPDTATLATPVLLTVEPSNQKLHITWQKVADATSYRLFWSNDANDFADVGDVNEHTLSGLQNGTTYSVRVQARAVNTFYFYVRVVDGQGNYNYFDPELVVSKDIGDVRTSAESNAIAGIPEFVEPYPVLPNEGCFVATAAFGHYDDADVQVLRTYRDQILKKTKFGYAFVEWYYRHGPAAAEWLNSHNEFKPVVRVLLYPLVIFSKLFLMPMGNILLLMTLFMVCTTLCLLCVRRVEKVRP